MKMTNGSEYLEQLKKIAGIEDCKNAIKRLEIVIDADCVMTVNVEYMRSQDEKQ